MTSIGTTCPRCGQVMLDNNDITLVMDLSQHEAWYLFDCIRCAHRVVKSASEAMAVALTSAQVAVSIVPAEAWEEAWLGREGPISTDELLDAILWLRAHDDVADQVSNPSPT